MYAESHGGWRQGLRELPERIVRTWKQSALIGLIQRVRYYRTLAGSTLTAPPPWETRSAAHASFGPEVPVTFVIVFSNSSADDLTHCLNSLQQQRSDLWELKIVCRKQNRQLHRQLRKKSGRQVELIDHEELSMGFLQALHQAKFEWIGLLEPDAIMRPNALKEITRRLTSATNIDWAYPDGIQSGIASRFQKGLLRPSFSPELFLSQFFTRGLNLIRKSAFEPLVKEQRAIVDDAFHYDVLLQLSERLSSERIVHWPSVLIEVGSADEWDAKAEAVAAENSLNRRAMQSRVMQNQMHPQIRSITVTPQRTPDVNIFISTRNAFDLVEKCVASIRKKTSYPRYNIIVIDNQSDQPMLLDYLERQQQADDFHVFRYDRPFNHSEMHNEAAQAFPSELMVFMNNDIELITENWLSKLVGDLELSSEIAGVGPLLLYPDGTIQHAGIALGVHYGAGHFFRGLRMSDQSYMHRAICLQRLSACTAALLLLKRQAFLEIGGFNAERYPASFNDVDLWIRLQNHGHRCLYDPSVQAFHYESKTRPIISNLERAAIERLRSDWPKQLLNDPFFHPAVSIENELLYGFRHVFDRDSRIETWSRTASTQRAA